MRSLIVSILQGRWQWVGVPFLLFTSSSFMALAWLGHLKFEQLPFLPATFFCWLLVFPEYFLNVSAIRLGYRFYTGAQMAAFRLCSGVICVALVSRFFLGETLSRNKLLGFCLMVIAMALIAIKPQSQSEASQTKVSVESYPQIQGQIQGQMPKVGKDSQEH